jgi:hypothetical protein
MNARVAAILVVLLVVLGGAALLAQREDSTQRPQGAAALGQPLLKDLKAADIARIRIVEPKSTLTLERNEAGWGIAERQGFPADVGKVRDFVVMAISLKIAQNEPVGEKDRARLALDASATQVEFAGANGKLLGKLLVGKKLFKSEPENPERAPADGRFVALPGDERTVYMVADPLTQATARTSAWIDRASFQVEKVKSLEVRYPAGGGWRVERTGDNAPWRLAGLGAREKVETSRVNAATYSLGLLELADVAPKDATAQQTGLDKPIVLDATTLEGRRYLIRVGKLQGDNYPIAFKASGGTEKPREKLLSDYVLLVPKSKLEDTLKPRSDLVEKKEAGKK